MNINAYCSRKNKKQQKIFMKPKDINRKIVEFTVG